ncbi:putative Aldo-keto reductase [Melia azedarach]|uniref:Aldo-keto reductase n=1 Tax=Melia azedarach TaxID=155640 RepID=A0ACC1XH18_MELAZ|nr:putative Aldo-keto reductase [Melia azedarach]
MNKEKMARTIPSAALSSTGKTIPLLGFGTADYPFLSDNEAVKESVLHAIELGYRHFDTAELYQSERSLGQAIAEALRLGFIKSRDELFITSKLWTGHAHRELVLPCTAKFSQESGNRVSRSLSNSFSGKLEAGDRFGSRRKLREFCKKKGVHITAYSPLGAKGTVWGSNRVLESEVLKEIATARGKTVAQVSLRWVYEQGVSLVVKSFNKKRMKENLDIFDWKLSAEELQKIEQIAQYRVNRAEFYVSEEGPFKSVETIWDGEI